MPELDDATRAQRVAADPARSTWLTANAGSGKTRVLTDRVARLLLGGTDPARILCLTYTKAAATEMQNRLLGRLGGWAMLDDARLAAELAALGETDTPDLAAARRLFAQAIETPGGLKVQTIHSFCAAVLRRFPLEAGVPQGFAELDDRSAANIRAEIVEEMAEARDPGFDALLAIHTGEQLDRFLSGLRGFTEPDPAGIWADAGLSADVTRASLARFMFEGGMGQTVAGLIPHLFQSSNAERAIATSLAGLDWSAPGLPEMEALFGCLLYKSGEKAGTAKIGKFPASAKMREACSALMDDLTELMGRAEQASAASTALAHAEKTLQLQRFGHAFERRYIAAKQAAGWLDFDDLIERTARLLSDSSMAQWVLFRLDGGIDHILVDEAQDTSPAQWQVITRLTDEFTAGAGAHDAPRTLFVVGDPKQSIYSFQGADIAVFAGRHADFSAAFRHAGTPLQDAALRHSFRSSPAVLSLVDAVFQGEAADGLEGEPQHIAFRAGLPGEVELWPPVPEPEAPEPAHWADPVDQAAPDAAANVLATAVADRVAALIGSPVPDPRGAGWRPARPGDVLILVQSRNLLFDALIAALKRRGVPVAGADRLKLGAELAVRDIRAVLSFLATPEDDLALAAALRSPLIGLSEDDLFRLAASRERYLIAALRQSEHRKAVDLLADLAGQADFLRPYELISRLLVRHGGRARLLARLGREAQDGIDELMSQALTYESSETPSLTGFLVWLSDDDIEVRRQPGAAGDGPGLVRVMTVHGSKGLESPIVILPDTALRGVGNEPRIIRPPGGGPAVWRGRKEERPAHVARWVDEQSDNRRRENRRLLYVALTRAETRLIIAAAGDVGADGKSWHSLIEAGFDRTTGLNEARTPAPWGGDIRRLRFGDWPAADPDQPPDAPSGDTAQAGDALAALPLPVWALSAPPPAPARRRPLAATALGGAKAVAGAGAAAANGAGTAVADGEELPGGAGMLYGTRLHLVLELLDPAVAASPDAIPPAQLAAVRAALSAAEGGLPSEAELDTLLADARAVLAGEALARVFAPGPDVEVLREVALAAPLPGGDRLIGTIDRLHIAPDEVTVIDYKSNSDVPATADVVPEGLLRQMAAYRHALTAIYPGRRIVTALLWTRTQSLMTLPDPVLDAAWVRAGFGRDAADDRKAAGAGA